MTILFENKAGLHSPQLKKVISVPLYFNTTGLEVSEYDLQKNLENNWDVLNLYFCFQIQFEFVGSSYKDGGTHMWLYFVTFSEKTCRTAEG